MLLLVLSCIREPEISQRECLETCQAYIAAECTEIPDTAYSDDHGVPSNCPAGVEKTYTHRNSEACPSEYDSAPELADCFVLEADCIALGRAIIPSHELRGYCD